MVTSPSPQFGSHFRLRFSQPVQSPLLSRQEEKRGWDVENFIRSEMDDAEAGFRIEVDGKQRKVKTVLSRSAANLNSVRGYIFGTVPEEKQPEVVVQVCGDANGLDVLCHDRFDPQVEARLDEFTRLTGNTARIEKIRTGIHDQSGMYGAAWQEILEIFDPGISEKGIAQRKLALEQQDTLMLESLANPAIPGLRRTQLTGAETGMLMRQFEKVPVNMAAISGMLNTLEVNAADEAGVSLLHWAALSQCPEAVQLFLEKGGNVHAVDSYGRTPLHHAVTCFNEFMESHTPERHVQVLEKLLEHQSDLNARDGDGMTPLMLAIEGFLVPSAKWLIEKGCDVTLPAQAVGNQIPAFTPMMLAISLQYDKTPKFAEVVALLQAKGIALPTESVETLKAWQSALVEHRAFANVMVVDL